MTLDEFLDLLRQTPRDWYITVEGRIRRNDKYSIPCCPISGCHPDGPKAVIYYVDAARLLGLGDLTGDIIRAADNDGIANLSLRARLLDACGLAS